MGGLKAGSSGIDFSLSATPGRQSIKAGNGAMYAVTVNPPALLGAVSLSTSNLPEGVTASFGPEIDVLKGQKNLYIFTTQDTPAISSQLMITATEPHGKTHSTSVSLSITPAADFSMSATPQYQNVKPGQSATYTINVGFGPNTVGPVNLATKSLPAGVTASISQATFNTSGTAVLTLTAASDATTSIDTVDLVASDNSGSRTIQLNLTVSPADFAIQMVNGPTAIDAGEHSRSS